MNALDRLTFGLLGTLCGGHSVARDVLHSLDDLSAQISKAPDTGAEAAIATVDDAKPEGVHADPDAIETDPGTPEAMPVPPWVPPLIGALVLLGLLLWLVGPSVGWFRHLGGCPEAKDSLEGIALAQVAFQKEWGTYVKADPPFERDDRTGHVGDQLTRTALAGGGQNWMLMGWWPDGDPDELHCSYAAVLTDGGDNFLASARCDCNSDGSPDHEYFVTNDGIVQERDLE